MNNQVKKTIVGRIVVGVVNFTILAAIAYTAYHWYDIFDYIAKTFNQLIK